MQRARAMAVWHGEASKAGERGKSGTSKMQRSTTVSSCGVLFIIWTGWSTRNKRKVFPCVIKNSETVYSCVWPLHPVLLIHSFIHSFVHSH